MKQSLGISLILGGALLVGGCATKKYVQETATPIQNKVDHVSDQHVHPAPGGELQPVDCPVDALAGALPPLVDLVADDLRVPHVAQHDAVGLDGVDVVPQHEPVG